MNNFEWTDTLVLDFAVKFLNSRIQFAVTHDCAVAPMPMQVELNNFKEKWTTDAREAEKQRRIDAEMERLKGMGVLSINDIQHLASFDGKWLPAAIELVKSRQTAKAQQ